MSNATAINGEYIFVQLLEIFVAQKNLFITYGKSRIYGPGGGYPRQVI